MVLAEEINTNIRDNIQFLSNGISTSLKNIVPMEIAFEEPKRQQLLHIKHGIMLETIGDLKGHLAILGDQSAFNAVATKMYGMALDGEMLDSFSCELTNMVGGSLATIMDLNNIYMDITAPRVITNEDLLAGAETAIQLRCLLENKFPLTIGFLVDGN